MNSSVQVWVRNVIRLTNKEFRSLLGDGPMMALILFSFSFAIYITAIGIKADVENAPVAVLDHDQSALSRQIRDAIQPPYFQAPVDIKQDAVDQALDKGDYIFVLDIPEGLEADVKAGRAPNVQILVDATAMTQAGLGAMDLSLIVLQETLQSLGVQGIEAQLPIRPIPRVLFNPNNQSRWFSGVMQIITNITALTIILVGAAVIREREHGTIEHLLVMPVRPSEIAIGKILANGSVILVSVVLSLWFVVHLVLAVPIPSPIPRTLLLFTVGTMLYLFALASLGILMATVTRSMPQFALLSAPVYVVLYLLSGASTPVESMPSYMQHIVQFSPTTQFVTLTQAVIYRGAGFDVVWPPLLAEIAFGALFLSVALARFRDMLARQG